ncbi:hypothetical protein KIPB_000907 [Kipferlia bialata]|uniref:Methyltransferase type 11 domain-containing protein n=1 Tax=Kipferlia bialata TaxID=797122 RepID=A0A9K3CPV7_9EUKA|nr:hypothetical protein KIPB_000907 [Kipferlia bialata]|eukprot:g907.t1
MTDSQNYAEKSYWAARYAQRPSMFDFYVRYENFRHLVEPHLAGSVRVLLPGSGTSRLPIQLHDDGFENVVALDYVPLCRQIMAPEMEARPSMQYLTMDVTLLDFESESFDVIVDKALLDTLLCGFDNLSAVQRYLREAHRVLREAGVLVIVSHSGEDTRLPVFDSVALSWDVTHTTIPKPLVDVSFSQAMTPAEEASDDNDMIAEDIDEETLAALLEEVETKAAEEAKKAKKAKKSKEGKGASKKSHKSSKKGEKGEKKSKKKSKK